MTLKVYTLLGEEVGTLLDGVQPAGTRVAEFSGGELPSGVYICKLIAARYRGALKMILQK